MALKITDFTGTTVAAGGAYPFGDVKDQPGGTLVDKAMVDDALQFFQKLMGLGGLTPNSLPDNATNGYQLIQALQGTWTNLPGGGYQSGWAAGANPPQYKIDGTGRVSFRGEIVSTSVSPVIHLFGSGGVLPVPIASPYSVVAVNNLTTTTPTCILVRMFGPSPTITFLNPGDIPTVIGSLVELSSLSYSISIY